LTRHIDFNHATPHAHQLGGIVQGRVQTGDAVPPLLALAVASSIRDALIKVTKAADSDLGIVHIASVAKKMKKEADQQLALGFEESA
jgi:hypothetical protein